jgi:alkanesulfonate monooxygenase SsuD/methylene tetrahydromethanopterin reductase-like flavin-dependent oxidoreductase (luciferase family)
LPTTPVSDVFATTEHHFHSEGYETSVAPLLLYADLAARTKRIKFSPLGLVLPSWDPIRAAEELAVLDHLTKGAGLCRLCSRLPGSLGQRPWPAIPRDRRADGRVGSRQPQPPGLRGDSQSHQEGLDRGSLGIQRRILQGPVSLRGRHQALAGREWTRTYGAPGEVDQDGVVRKICVVPKPYQEPHPPLFQPFSVSENTIRYTAQSGIVPWILVSYPPDFRRLCRLYREVAAANGRNLRLGESVGGFRAVHFGGTEEEAVALFRDTNYAGFYHYFGGFGFAEAFRLPEDAEKYPPPTMLPQSEWTVDRFRKAKYAIAGTVDQVKREIEELKTLGGEGDLEWFGWFFDQGFMPWDEEMRQIELFAEHIIPAFR